MNPVSTFVNHIVGKSYQAALPLTTGTEPVNALSGKTYYGDNAATLRQAAASNDYVPTHWATLKQWNKLKHTVAKGEKGTKIVFCETHQDAETGEPFKVVKQAYLFNRCQLKQIRQLPPQ